MARSAADAFLDAILQNPDDDTPRLIYADWLEEQGDPSSVARAEFIRVQCALAEGELPPRQRTDLKRREQQLLDEYSKEWVQPVRRRLRSWKFHRGFLGEIEIPSHRFVSCADLLFRQAPIQHVHLVRSVRAHPRFSIPVIADCEHLRRVHSLDLRLNRLETRDVRALVVSEHLTSLTGLNLSYNFIGDGGIRALADSPLLGRLIGLDLRHNDFGPAGVRALARALHLLDLSADGLRMRKLILHPNNLGTAGQRIIADSALLRRLVGC